MVAAAAAAAAVVASRQLLGWAPSLCCHPLPCASPPSQVQDCVRKQVTRSQKVETKDGLLRLSRRTLLQSFLLATATTHSHGNEVLAEDLVAKSCDNLVVTDKVFFDIAIDREPAGRIVIGVFGEDAPIGTKRFVEIALGKRGVSYRKKEFDKVTSSYIQNAGVRNFSLSGGTADAAYFTGGETADSLIPELEELNKKCTGIKNLKGTVSIVVKDPTKPPPKTKLIAKSGKFEVVEEELRPDPNGTEFAIATEDSPQLDTSNLVVGRVLEGMDVLRKIASVKVVQENTSSPYFRAAKLIGDTRAVVAERGFNRPYSKITITRCGEVKE